MKITFFGTQPYDRESFDRANASFGFEFNYHRSHLNGNNALLAQGAGAVQAAAAGVWLHGRAGDLAEQELTAYGMTPEDTVNHLPLAIREILE